MNRKSPVDSLIDSLSKRPRKLPKRDYAFFLINLIKEDIDDALKEPDLWREIVQSAKDKLHALVVDLEGDEK